jgi:hypothetical protein
LFQECGSVLFDQITSPFEVVASLATAGGASAATKSLKAVKAAAKAADVATATIKVADTALSVVKASGSAEKIAKATIKANNIRLKATKALKMAQDAAATAQDLAAKMKELNDFKKQMSVSDRIMTHVRTAVSSKGVVGGLTGAFTVISKKSGKKLTAKLLGTQASDLKRLQKAVASSEKAARTAKFALWLTGTSKKLSDVETHVGYVQSIRLSLSNKLDFAWGAFGTMTDKMGLVDVCVHNCAKAGAIIGAKDNLKVADTALSVAKLSGNAENIAKATSKTLKATKALEKAQDAAAIVTAMAGPAGKFLGAGMGRGMEFQKFKPSTLKMLTGYGNTWTRVGKKMIKKYDLAEDDGVVNAWRSFGINQKEALRHLREAQKLALATKYFGNYDCTELWQVEVYGATNNPNPGVDIPTLGVQKGTRKEECAMACKMDARAWAPEILNGKKMWRRPVGFTMDPTTGRCVCQSKSSNTCNKTAESASGAIRWDYGSPLSQGTAGDYGSALSQGTAGGKPTKTDSVDAPTTLDTVASTMEAMGVNTVVAAETLLAIMVDADLEAEASFGAAFIADSDKMEAEAEAIAASQGLTEEASEVDPEYTDKESATDYARTAAGFASMADPTGITSVVAAYAYEVCTKYFGCVWHCTHACCCCCCCCCC